MYQHLLDTLPAAQHALVWAALCVVAMVAIVRCLANHSPDTERFWRRATLAAELCSAFGLMGLVSFAGRAYVDESKKQILSNVARAEADASEALNAIGRNFCLDERRAPRTFSGSGHTLLVCQTWRNTQLYDPRVDWESVQQIFDAFGYRQESDSAMRPTVRIAAEKIEILMSARRQQTLEQYWGDTLRPSSNWSIVLLAAGFVGLGVSIKSAKAWAELSKPPSGCKSRCGLTPRSS